MTNYQEYSLEAYTPTDLGSDITVYRARRDPEHHTPTKGKWFTNKEAAARDLHDMMCNAKYLNAPDNQLCYRLGELLKKYDFVKKDTDFDSLIKE